MRSNNSAAPNTQATNQSMMRRVSGIISKGSKKEANWLTLGVTGKQWLASLMICTMLSSVFALPVRAAIETNAYQAALAARSNPNNFETVNEPLPFWKEAWMDLNAKTEAWLTPMRAVNAAYKDSDDKDATSTDKPKTSKPSSKEMLERRVKTLDIQIDKKKKIIVGQTFLLVGIAQDADGKTINGIIPNWISSNPEILKINENGQAVALKAGTVSLKAGAGAAEKEVTVKVEANENTSKEKVSKNAPSSLALKAANIAFDVTPEQADRPILDNSELPVLVSPDDNLGSPPGQTEPVSSIRASATKTRDRAGIGNFSFELPVASLPGRGISASIGLSYNSQLWTRTGSAANYQYTYNVDGNWMGPGFQIGYGYLDTYTAYGTVPTQLILTDTDGTRHQLDLTVASGGHASYESNDASFTKSDITYNTSSNAIISTTVTYTDGTKVLYGAANPQNRHFPDRITDIQGNYISISYLTGDQVGKIASVTDTLGRNIVFHYDTTTEQNLISVTVPGYNNSSTPRQTIRFYYESLTLQAQNSLAQNRFAGTITAPPAVTVLKYIYYPGSKTGFRYDYSAAYGMIYKITRLDGMQVTNSPSNPDTPDAVITTSGAYLESATTHYDYPRSDVNLTAAALTDVPKYYNRTDDWIGRDTSATAPNTNYLQTENINSTTHVGTQTMTVTSPNGSINASISIVDPGVWDDGLTKETSVTSSGRTIPWAKTTFEWEPSTATTGRRNPRVSKIIQTNEVGQAKATAFTYDDYDNPTIASEYDFDPTGQATTELRRTETTYITSGDWIANRLVHLPLSVKKIVNDAVVSRTDYEYDHNALTDRANIIQHDSTYSSSNTQSNARGNITKTTTFINPTNATVNPTDANDSVTTMNYDIAGNETQATLNCCNLKTWTYDSTNNTYAYTISEITGTDVQLTTSATYDFNTGLVRTSTNENNQPTTYDYESDTLRQSKVTYPDGGGYVQTEYSDKLITTTSQLSPGYVKQTTLLDTNKTVQSYSYYDGNDAPIRNATQTPDGWSISATVYDPIGRPKKTYNPFYGLTQTDTIPSNLKWIEVTVYDGLDRATQAKLQDGTVFNTYYNEAAVTYTDPANQQKQGTATRVKDQADKETRRVVDALGRVIRVDEPDVVTNSLGSITSPNQPTYYSYDGNDNLTKVSQSASTTTQERRFKYDALSQLIAEKQVEAIATLDDSGTVGTPDANNKWTKVIKYNARGDVTDGYDARGVHTHIDYDGLNRIWKINSSDDSPKVTYTYDQSRTGFYNNGALTRVETAQNTTNPRADTPDTATEFDYDKIGRVRQQRQTIGTQTYNLGYGYNLAGQLTSESYPSGKVITTGYDDNGRLADIADQSRTYMSGLQYQGKGTSLSSMNLGNGTSQTMTLNDRLQIISQSLSKGTNVLQKYDYGYGQIDANGNLVATKNNGQLAKIDSIIGTAQQWTQKFSYDAIGRLSSANEYRGDTGTLSYAQQFDYDRFGNLYRKAQNNQTGLLITPIEDSDISKTTNRFTTGTAYDNAGNVTQDTKFRSLNLSYDANGRVFKTSNTDNTNPANSVYDAAGNRVATQVDGVWSFFIYDIGGKLVSEYGGLAAMDEGGVKYVMQDRQGSARAILSNTGTVQSRMDFTAFGEEIGFGVGLRTTGQGFGATNGFSQKYGLTERDKATGLDHTWFRKNENRAGRWISPDPYNGSMNLGNPQSFNRYAYVQNDPINLVDPSGLFEACIHKAMTKFLAKLGGLSDEASDKLAHFASGEQGGADSFKYSAANPINFVEAIVRQGPSNNIHFASEARLQREEAAFQGYVDSRNYKQAGFVLHSIEDVRGAHQGFHAPIGHLVPTLLSMIGIGENPDAVIGDAKFLQAANEVLQVVSNNKDASLTAQQVRDLIKAIRDGCGKKAKHFTFIDPPVTGGGSGGGETISYIGGGWSQTDWIFFLLDLLSQQHQQIRSL